MLKVDWSKPAALPPVKSYRPGEEISEIAMKEWMIKLKPDNLRLLSAVTLDNFKREKISEHLLESILTDKMNSEFQSFKSIKKNYK